MWITLLVMAVVVSLEPFRVGMTVLMLNRPRPLRQLLAFLGGGFAMGVTVGLVVLFVVRSAVRPEQFTLPRVQVAIGALALLIAAMLSVLPTRVRPGRDRVSAWGRRLAGGSSLRLAAVAGLGIALPSIDYLAALAVIAASGAPASTQIAALLTFNAMAFVFVEIPLLAYLMAPGRTQAATTSLYASLRSRGRRGFAVLLAVIGCVLLSVGLAGL
ncbi:GAP family protein [Mycobacterium sp. NPDC051804]|uniref:GAP family protein n=1 Tax=Mycobacterium sp. NPDC051804 TaxID=3364295 RepID=UPI003788E7F2